jgi:hypothetical protein
MINLEGHSASRQTRFANQGEGLRTGSANQEAKKNRSVNQEAKKNRSANQEAK